MDRKHDDFFYAVMINDFQGVQDFLNSGINVDTMDNTGCTALHLASSCGFIEIVNLLISRCATIDIQSSLGNTAFHMACRWGQFQIVRRLLDCHADEGLQNQQGYTGLHFASYFGHSVIVKILLEEYSGSCVDTLDRRRYTALHMACLWGNLAVVKTLLAHNSSLNLLTIDDETPLDIASNMNRDEIVHYLESYLPLEKECDSFAIKRGFRGKLVSFLSGLHSKTG